MSITVTITGIYSGVSDALKFTIYSHSASQCINVGNQRTSPKTRKNIVNTTICEKHRTAERDKESVVQVKACPRRAPALRREINRNKAGCCMKRTNKMTIFETGWTCCKLTKLRLWTRDNSSTLMHNLCDLFPQNRAKLTADWPQIYLTGGSICLW